MNPRPACDRRPADIIQAMPYRIVDKRVLYTGQRFRLETHYLEDDHGNRTSKEVINHPGAVVILPFLDPQTILLIHNRRHSIGEVLLELPAGTLEKNEDPINCAGRELEEETGFLAGRLKAMGWFYTSPGVLTERMYMYIALDLQPSATRLDEAEEIDVAPTKLSLAIDMIRTGQIHDGKTIATLLWHKQYLAE
jgi:ADP-ribose pyrophosphatase